MRIYVRESREIYRLSMRDWDDESLRFGPDYFDSIEEDIPRDFPFVEDIKAYSVPLISFLDCIQFWSNHKSSATDLDIDFVSEVRGD